MIPTHTRWIKIRELFFAALEANTSSRIALLQSACEGDESLEWEVRRLLDLDARVDSLLDRPACDRESLLEALSASPSATVTAPQLSPGDLIADRFSVLSLIGAGGMGEVYEARDEVLGGTIALKVMRPGCEPIEIMEERLRREAQFARRVTHNSVCRVHDVIRHVAPDGRDFLVLTMERLRGQTLRQRLDDGDLPMAYALDIAQQVGAGLDAAHAEGVLHRDVKPENIILEPRVDGSCRAVLTDFGLAHPTTVNSASLRMTQTGMLAGTPAYMAPELLQGEQPSVRSDVFAFAVVVREMLLRATPAMSNSQRQHLQRGLDHDPDERFPTARKLVNALVTPPPEPRLLAPTPAPNMVQLVVLLPIGLLGMVFLVYWIGVHLLTPAMPRIPPSSSVLFTDLANETNDRELDGATEVLRSQLAQSPHFELVKRDRIAVNLVALNRAIDSAFEPELARNIATWEGAPLIVSAVLRRSANEYVVSVKLELVGTPLANVYQPWTRDFSAQFKNDLFDAIHRAAAWTREMSGESASELNGQNRPPAETASTSWQALHLYTQAEALILRGNEQFALLTLNEAVRIDPKFATAHARLADLLIRHKRKGEGYAAWHQTVALNKRRQSTREALILSGRYFEEISDFAEAEQIYRTYATRYPNDFSASLFLGNVLVVRARVQEAIPWFEKASRLRPRALAALVSLSLANLDAARFEQALHHTASVSLVSGEWAQWLRALALFGRMNVQAALSALEPLRAGDNQWRSRVSLTRASWLSELGDDAQAAAELQAGIQYDAAHGLRDGEADKRLALAALEFRANRRAAAIVNVQRALDIEALPHRLAMAGELAARAGNLEQARERLLALDRYADDPKIIEFKERLRGEILLGEGDAAGAVRVFADVVSRRPRPEYRIVLARALSQIGNVEEAERTLLETLHQPARFYIAPAPHSPGMWRGAVGDLIASVERHDVAAATNLRSMYRDFLSRPTK
jgi:eukaryotic-like serine/threonine-protein kinase